MLFFIYNLLVALSVWDNISKPKDYGGVGIRDQNWQNIALARELV